MKKMQKFSLLLALLLVLQALSVPTLATEVGDPTDVTETSETVEATDPTDESGPEEGESLPTEDTEPSDPTDPTESSEATEPTESSEATEPSESTEPTEPVWTIPEGVTGDASISYGSNTINGMVPLMPEDALDLELSAALIYEINSETLLYGSNIDQRLYPASLTKVMTCLLALEYGNLDQVCTVSEAALSNMDPDGSNVGLVVGEQMAMKDLIYCLMVSSANDAGAVIAETIAGTEEAFVAMMNEKAQELGCTGTHFANPHGLHDENHYTTARDLARITLAAMEYELFHEVYGTVTYTVPATNKKDARELRTTNYMLDDTQVGYYYDTRYLGGKTGFTTPAGRCLISVAQEGDLTLLTVAMGGKTSINDMGQTSLGNFRETRTMVNFGFESFTFAQVLNPDVVLATFSVSNAENFTQASVEEPVNVVVPLDLDKNDLQYEFVLEKENLTAPVRAGDRLGVARVWYHGMCLAQQQMYATIDAPVRQAQPVEGDKNASGDEGAGNLIGVILRIALIAVAVIVVLFVLRIARNAIARAARRKRRRQNRRRSR